ncbi:protein DOP1A isoform X3 [Oratosquilla oratoria]|uniref:protein DOP1A isoform X3 n=1 Tax=Oratosquilla oratoria TaxID=337810 RepID=UPI003F76DDF1
MESLLHQASNALWKFIQTRIGLQLMSGLSLEEYELLGDPKYRGFVAAVDKTLRNFENTSEWADLISTLGKLNKVLLSHMKFPVVPRRITISKRLAQCMHPALPSGVHLKALETYDILFKCMGTNRLSQELFIYSAGLFPLFSSAAMNVRSALLTVYETHFVPLGPRLRPGLNGFLSGILAGLEEGSDHLERTSQLLSKVAEGVGLADFFGCVWECVWGNSAVRLPAVTHITSSYNKKLSTEDQLFILGTNVDVMVEGICMAVEDSSVLVQRAALDLILSALPMHNTQLLKVDLVKLVSSAILVLLRRDMSLNRRLYSWLLGSEVNLSVMTSEHPVMKRLNSVMSDTITDDGSEINVYFDTFSRPLLVEAVVATLSISQGVSPPDLRPYRLIVSLLDKPEIGPHILDDIFLDLLRCLYHTSKVLKLEAKSTSVSSRRQSTSDKMTQVTHSTESIKSSPDGNKGLHEVSKTATLLFSALQPSYPWLHLLGLLRQACQERVRASNVEDLSDQSLNEVNSVGSPNITVIELCTLLQHLLASLSLETQQQTQASRLPEVLTSITALLTENITVLTSTELTAGLQLCRAVLHKLIPSVTLPPVALSRPESRASISTFTSLQFHGFSQGGHPLSVREVLARESPPTDSGIVQIGIEANEYIAADERSNCEPDEDQNLSFKVSDEELEESKRENCTEENNGENDDDGGGGGGDDNASPTARAGSGDDTIVCSSRVSSGQEGEDAVPSSGIEEDVQDTACINGSQDTLHTVALCVDDYIENNSISDTLHTNGEDHCSAQMNTEPRNPEPSEEEFESAPQSLSCSSQSPLHDYVIEFERFFLQMICTRIVDNITCIHKFQKIVFQLLSSKNEDAELIALLKECLRDFHSPSGDTQQSQSCTNGNSKTEVPLQSAVMLPSQIPFQESASHELDVFQLACNVLVDLSSLPITPGMQLNPPPISLPQWLVALLVCVLYGHQVSPQFVLTAATTLLELVTLAQSEMSIWSEGAVLQPSGRENEEGTVMVNITPLLLPSHTHQLLCIEIYQFMTRRIWEYLDASTAELHINSVELLLQMHSLTMPNIPHNVVATSPQSTSVVEQEILRAITDPLPSHQKKARTCKHVAAYGEVIWSHDGITIDYDCKALQKWVTLWQVSRNLVTSGTSQGFDRCLFLMVERLRGDSGPERALAHSWLGSILQRGDTARLLDPILALLLHPQTRRVSVQHVNIEKVSNQSTQPGVVETNDDQYIFAISSVGGEVMYHVSRDSHEIGKGKTERHVLTFTSLSNDSKVVTHHAHLTDLELPSSYEHSHFQAPMSLMINPFTQHPWIDMEDLVKMNRPPNLSNAVRFENGSYQKQLSGSRNDSQDSSIQAEKKEMTPIEIAQSIIDEIIDNAIANHQNGLDSERSSESEKRSQTCSQSTMSHEMTVHPLHSHMLLYTQVIDSGQCLYGLSLVRNLIEAQPRLLLLTLASSSISSLKAGSPLLVLLARHRRSVFGEGFDGVSVNELVSQFRSTMYLQVVITVCLYYLRSYYPRLPHLRLREEHLRDNQEVQVAACEVLIRVFTHLTPLITDSPRGFTPYVADLLNKCKVQKCVLHCLLSTVHAIRGLAKSKADLNSTGSEVRTFTEDVLEYNSVSVSDKLAISPYQETYLMLVIELTSSLIKLEDTLAANRSDNVTREPPSISLKYSGVTSSKYQPGQPIPAQPMFTMVIFSALKLNHLRHLHSSWLNLFTSALPHMGHSLPSNALRLTSLLCESLEELATLYLLDPNMCIQAPPDHTLTLLQGLTTVVHFCLLDSPSLPTQGTSQTVTPVTTQNSGQSAGQILYNLLHVFSPMSEILDAPIDTSGADVASCARRTLLSHLPRIISALLSLWRATPCNTPSILGNGRTVRQHIIELLSPVSHHHTPHVLAAVSVVWQGISNPANEKKGRPMGNPYTASVCSAPTDEQCALVEMLSSLKVLPLHTLVSSVKQVVKQPPIVEGASQVLQIQQVPLEVSVLQFFFVYVQRSSGSQLSECWTSLVGVIREGSSLTPPAQLVLLATLNEFVQRAPQLQDKKDMKEVQDVAGKLLESCGNIAGSCLEATTWLRRNLTVRTDTFERKEDEKDDSRYSVAALSVLAELLAPLLDVLYVSEEKDKVIPLLTNIMAYVIPYLRNHMKSNMEAFSACSQLLSSLSGYQYTLKAWRKEVLELLLDPQAFVMEPHILPYWRTIVDNLYTHDKTIFKELLNRVSMSQGGSLSLFSSKESEYENRAGLLKRLAFTIFCSETDQYIRHIPDIQERLSEVTRLGQVIPGLVAGVLLCFRVLLLRMSPRGVTSLWPVIITELVQVFLMIEQELATDTEQFSSHLKRLSTLDSWWVVSASNGLNAHNHPAWLTLYLAACKLLDLMLALPASHLPQFQMYRWAFVGPIPESPAIQQPEAAGGFLLKKCDFIPHIARIAKLMGSKAGSSSRCLEHEPGHLLLTCTSISTLQELQPFFNTLASPNFTTSAHHQPGQATLAPSQQLQHVEAILEQDFLEPLPM